MGLTPAENRAARPRVVHITTAHRADDVRIFERECRSLAASGRYDVYLAAAGSIPASSGVTCIPLAPSPVTRLGRFSSGPRRALGLSRTLSADIWHFHDPELLPIALKLARSGARVIWDAHEDYVAQFTEDGGKGWVPRPVRGVVLEGMKAMLNAVDRHAAGVVAATPTIAARYSNPRTVVVGNEARLEDFWACAPRPDNSQVLFTGSPSMGHLFGEIIDAVDTFPHLTLAVGGRLPPPELQAAAERRLGTRYRHLGWLDRAGLAEAISDSVLGFVTYADVPAYGDLEGSPTKLYEFAAGRLPVVATPNGAAGHLVAQFRLGEVAGGFTSQDLSRAMERLITNQAAWATRSHDARLWVSRAGGWEASEARLLRLYSELMPTE